MNFRHLLGCDTIESDHKTHRYMKRLKSLWDEKRPEYNQLSEKYLPEQAKPNY